MANQEYLDILKQGVEVWNKWRQEHRYILLDLRGVRLRGVDLRGVDLSETNLFGADLSGADLSGADLSAAFLREVYLRGANLTEANVSEADLSEADLNRANLRGANLSEANLTEANVSGADLSEADLNRANLNRANLNNANFDKAEVLFTIFGDTDLRHVKGLDTVNHRGPSTIGIDTIYRSQGVISETFLHSAGVPDLLIDYTRSLVGKPIDYYTCFISYSSRDQAFSERLYADLQSKGVRCWFAPEHMDIGDKIRPRIEESIRLYDKLLLVLSENSIASNWVAYEVERALNKEPTGIPNVLYPIRLDDKVMTSREGWANDIKSTRHIGDFSNWKNHDDYQKAFSKLLRALKSGGKK
jgi:hypothetical protein